MGRHVRDRVGGIAGLLVQALAAGMAYGQEGTDCKFPDPWGKAKKGQPPPEVQCWLPKDCAYVRGVVVAHPMIARLATDPLVRKVAAEEGLGMMVASGVFAFTGKESIERLDQVFAQWAEKSGHPEIKGARRWARWGRRRRARCRICVGRR